MDFYSTFSLCAAVDYTGTPWIAQTRLVRRAPAHLPPCSRPCRKPAPQGPRNAKRRQDFSCRQTVPPITVLGSRKAAAARSSPPGSAVWWWRVFCPIIAKIPDYGLQKALRTGMSQFQNVLALLVKKMFFSASNQFWRIDCDFFLKKSRKIMFQGIDLLTNRNWLCFINSYC